jgi:hypothetical protein
MNSVPEKPGRRRFFASVVRYVLLGALGLIGGRLAARAVTGPLHPEETCVNRGVCRGCRVLPGCGSPQATLFRQVEERR